MLRLTKYCIVADVVTNHTKSLLHSLIIREKQMTSPDVI